MKQQICKLYASCGGNFTDRLSVHIDTDLNRVVLEVTCGVPRGGMDGDPEPFYRRTEQRLLGMNVTAKTLLQNVKQIIAKKNEHLFKDYGRPTKNTLWYTGETYPKEGLSIKLCELALTHARERVAAAAQS